MREMIGASFLLPPSGLKTISPDETEGLRSRALTVYRESIRHDPIYVLRAVPP